MGTIRGFRLSSLGVLLLLCIVGATVAGGCGACAQQLPGLEPLRAAPGETVRLSGGSGGFGAPCNDTPGAGIFESASPEEDIRIELRQGGRIWHLDTIDAREDYTLDSEFEIPTDAEPGSETILINSQHAPEPLRLSFRVIGREVTS